VGALAFALFARGVERDGADVLDTHTAAQPADSYSPLSS
jgi:hypothetical protein